MSTPATTPRSTTTSPTWPRSRRTAISELPPGVGTPAPDFTLKDQNNQPTALSDFRGVKNVLLVFYPFAFSGICTGELCQIRDDLQRFVSDRTQTLAISVDHIHALKTWAKAQAFDFPLLADFWPHGEVASRYGVFHGAAGFARRGTFVIDRDGLIRYRAVNQIGEPRDPDDWRAALAELGG